jgi:hypothetical protein
MNAWQVVPNGDLSQIDAFGFECPLLPKADSCTAANSMDQSFARAVSVEF